MFPKYVFHRESEEELKEFLQVATELQQNPEQCVAINAYLNEVSVSGMLNKKFSFFLTKTVTISKTANNRKS